MSIFTPTCCYLPENDPIIRVIHSLFQGRLCQLRTATLINSSTLPSASDCWMISRRGFTKAGQQIPTENELCTQYNVSRITIRKAISDLVADGVLRSAGRKKGTFVQSQKVENACLLSVVLPILARLKARRRKRKSIGTERVSAAPFLRKAEHPGNSEVFHLCRVMYPIKSRCLLIVHGSTLSRYPDFDEIYVEGSSTYQLFQERFDTRVVSDKKTIDIFATRPQAMAEMRTGRTVVSHQQNRL